MWHKVLLPSPPPYKHSTLGSPSMSPHTPQSIVPKCTSTHRQLALQGRAKTTPQRRARQRWGTSATAGAASGTWGLCQEIGITPAPARPWHSRASPGLPLERRGGSVAQPPPMEQTGTKQAALWPGAGVAGAQMGGSAFLQDPDWRPRVRQWGSGPAHFHPPQGCATLQSTTP